MAIIGRSKFDHPALGDTGGSALHASIENIYETISDCLSGRFETASAVANSTATDFDHNYGVQFSDLAIMLYTGTHPNLTRVSDPTADGWTIAAKVGSEKTHITVTTPSSGGPHTYAVFITHGGQYLNYPSEVASIVSSTLTPASGSTIQRITSTSGDLREIASPSPGKLLVLINETGASFSISNDHVSATAANRIYTGFGADTTIENNGSITVVYSSSLSRWMVISGSAPPHATAASAGLLSNLNQVVSGNKKFTGSTFTIGNSSSTLNFYLDAGVGTGDFEPIMHFRHNELTKATIRTIGSTRAGNLSATTYDLLITAQAILFSTDGTTKHMALSSAGGLTAGPSGSASSSLVHRINIPSVSSLSVYSNSASFGALGAFTSNSGLGVLGNAHTDNSTGLALDAGTKDTNSSPDMIFRVRENDVAAGSDFATTTTTAFSWRRYTTEIATASRAGTWAFGSTAVDHTHKFQSGGATVLNIETAANAVVQFALKRTVNTAQEWQWYIPAGSNELRLWTVQGAANYVSAITNAGAFTLGPSSGLTSPHVIQSAPATGPQLIVNDSSGSGFGLLGFGVNSTSSSCVIGAIGTAAGATSYNGSIWQTNSTGWGSGSNAKNSSLSQWAVSLRSPATDSSSYPSAWGDCFTVARRTAFTGASDWSTYFQVGSTGNCTIGPAVTGNSTGQGHKISGYLYSANVTSTANSGFIGLGNNVKFGGNNAQQGRIDTTTSGTGIELHNRTSTTETALIVYANAPGDATSTTATIAAQMLVNGSWTFGPSASTAAHTFYGGVDAATPVAYVRKGSSSTTSSDLLEFYSSNTTYEGSIRLDGSGNLVIDNTSDARLKENIRDLPAGLSVVVQLQPRLYDWISKDATDVAGFIAQELDQVLPRCVNKSDEHPWSVSLTGMVPYIVKAIQELNTEIAALKAQVS